MVREPRKELHALQVPTVFVLKTIVLVLTVPLQPEAIVSHTTPIFVRPVPPGFTRMVTHAQNALRVDRVNIEQGLIVMVVETMILKRATHALIVTRANTKQVPHVAMELEGVLLKKLVQVSHEQK